MTTLCAYLRCKARVTTKIEAELCDRHCQEVYLSIDALIKNAALRHRVAAVGASGRARPRAATTLGVVYFARLGDQIKIGFTTNLRQRMQSIRHDEVLATIPGTIRDEKALHMRFGHLWVDGEWFRAEGELLRFIAAARVA